LKPLRNIGLVWGWSAIFFGTGFGAGKYNAEFRCMELGKLLRWKSFGLRAESFEQAARRKFR
jgi:hypothetical protein